MLGDLAVFWLYVTLICSFFTLHYIISLLCVNYYFQRKLLLVFQLLERLVSSQLMKYLKDNDLLPDLQSAYKAMHSTETAVFSKCWPTYCWRWIRVIWRCWHVLDLSAAFDSVDHDATEAAAKVLRSWRAGAELVRFIFVWPCSTRMHIGGLFYTVRGSVRTEYNRDRFGPRADPILSVHRGPAAVSEAPLADSSRLRGRHSRSTGFEDPQLLPRCPPVSTRFRRGWRPIGCSWVTPRPTFSGVHHHVDNIRSPLIQSTLGTLSCS